MVNSKNPVNYEKINVYIAAASVIGSILAAVIYVAVSLAEINLKIQFAERLKEVEVKVEHLEKK